MSKQLTEEQVKARMSENVALQDRKFSDLLRYLWKPKFLERPVLERPLGLESYNDATMAKWLSDELDELEACRVDSANTLWNRLSELDDVVGCCLELRARGYKFSAAQLEKLRLVTSHIPHFTGVGELYFALRVLKAHFRRAQEGLW